MTSLKGTNDSRIPQSLQPLALMALQAAGAEGYSIYELDPATEVWALQLAWGTPVPESRGDGLTEQPFIVESFPLGAGDAVSGILTFVFRDRAIAPVKRALLERIAGVIEAVWRLSLLPAAYARNAARIGELEMGLADSKIADRAHGLLGTGAPSVDAIDTIVKHVESVLRPGQFATVLGNLKQEMEQEIVERELAARAKAVLQSRYGMSEQQAHVHLRLVSRKSRKRMRDVARDLVAEAAAGR
jgi:hypothetical protein